jgi:hypothetical protein
VADADDEDPVVAGHEVAEVLLEHHRGPLAHGRHRDDAQRRGRLRCQAQELQVPVYVGARGGRGVGREAGGERAAACGDEARRAERVEPGPALAGPTERLLARSRLDVARAVVDVLRRGGVADDATVARCRRAR